MVTPRQRKEKNYKMVALYVTFAARPTGENDDDNTGGNNGPPSLSPFACVETFGTKKDWLIVRVTLR